VRRAEWRCAFQPELPRRTPRSAFHRYARKARNFLAAFERLPRSPRFPLAQPERAGAYDAVLIGSDEVWNFRHPWYGSAPIFFGQGLKSPRIVSYAASFGNHDADDGIHPDWVERLRRFTAISVRDENSRRLISQGLGAEPEVVLDPCLQFPPAQVGGDGDQPYIAVYGHSFPDWFKRAIRAYASERGLPLVSIGYRNDWVDFERIEVGPEAFSELIGRATAVATNFFHGCVFALHHRRPFACAPSDYRFNKVRDLTRKLAAEHHLVDEATPDAAFAELLERPLNPAISARIEALRVQSMAYLESALG
jgi:hypothetical protein